MKRNLAILFMMTAIFALVAHMVIPHHEHGEKVCFESSSCESENENSQKEHACCFDQQKLVRSENEDQNYNLCNGGNTCDLHFPPILLFIGNFFELDNHPLDISKPYLNLYTSADIGSACTLRGPPQI